MFIQMARRSYRMTRRAETRDETRARIVDAAVALHEELGPRATTVSAVAERAGVQRLTVYRHFPDDEAMFAACSAAWAGRHPLPDIAGLPGAGRQSCRAGLALLYGYYRENARMLASVTRDAAVMPVLAAPRARAAAQLEAYLEGLLARLSPPLSRAAFARATLAHAVRFETWQSLAAGGLDDDAKADLVMAWLD
jgi:AcrR family transcriptional regulator